MNKAYSFIVVLIAVVVLGFCLALILADDAEAATYDVKLTYADPKPIKVAVGRNPVQFNYSVTNTGESPSAEIFVQLDSAPSAWNVYYTADPLSGLAIGTYNPSVPFEFLLGKNEKCNLSMTVTTGLNDLNMTYWFHLNAYPKRDPGRNSSYTVGVVIPQRADFEIMLWNPPPNSEYKAIPPSTVTIRFAIYNKGNGVDRFLIQGESTRETAGWKFSFVSGVNEFGFSPNLSADPLKKSPHFIDVKVPIPAGERAFVTAHITVNATSMFNSTKQIAPAFAQITSLQYYAFQVIINGLDRKEGVPGNEVEFQIKITNQGNGWDTFTIKPIWDPDLNPSFIASANPRTLDIDRNESKTIQYIVKVPTNAQKKTYFFTAEMESISPELSPVTKSFAVEVKQYYAIKLSAMVSRMGTIPGGSLEFDVVVKNIGNGLDSILIELIQGAPKSWPIYVQPPEVTLTQNQEAIIKIIVIASEKQEEAPIGSYNLTVPAISTRSDAHTQINLFVDITQFYRIEWMYQGEDLTNENFPEASQGSIRPQRRFNPYAQNEIDYVLEVKNYGNGDDNINMTGYSPDPRITVALTPAYTKLLRNDVKYIKVHIEFPKTLETGVYVIYVNASSQDPEFVTRKVPVDFVIDNVDARAPVNPIFIDKEVGDVVRPEINVNPKTMLSFKVRIENNGTQPLQGVLIRAYDNYGEPGKEVRWNFFNFTTPPIAINDRYIVGERDPLMKNPPLSWWANVSGSHKLEFIIFYDAQSNLENDISTVDIMVEKAEEGGNPITQPVFLGTIIAVVVAALIVAGYVFALRRKPQVDADLYSSIYGADFEEPITTDVDAAPEAAEAGTALTPEQQALYGDDYSAEGADYDYDGDYDYDDYEDGEYADDATPAEEPK